MFVAGGRRRYRPGDSDLAAQPQAGGGGRDRARRGAPVPVRFADARRRLDELLADRHVPVVLSGHVHQYRVLDLNGRPHVWVPTSWAVLPEEIRPCFGDKRVGVLRVEVDPSGEARTTMVEPAGLRQLTLTEDIAGPYHP